MKSWKKIQLKKYISKKRVVHNRARRMYPQLDQKMNLFHHNLHHQRMNIFQFGIIWI